MKRIALLGLAALLTLPLAAQDAEAAKKKKKPKQDYTSEQRNVIYQRGLDLCRKKYGPALGRVKVDYKKGTFICYVYY